MPSTIYILMPSTTLCNIGEPLLEKVLLSQLGPFAFKRGLVHVSKAGAAMDARPAARAGQFDDH